MFASRVKVGQPLGGSRFRTTVGMKWEGGTRVRRASSLKLRQGKASAPRSRPQPESPAMPQAVPDIPTPPLSFLSVRNFCVLAGLALVVILLVLGMVRSNHQAVAYSYEISELTQKKLQLLEENRSLSSELAQASSLPQLEKAVRNSLKKLIRPQQGQIVVID